ncbi:MAG: Crp/Fnr family transcriptional regulator [Clostridia bacterium]|nr:Crp/Fnr family transcriptional regulator [Clostridia bacterium]
MKEYFGILRKCPLFEQIGDEDLTALLDCLGARIVKYNKKATVITEGEPAKNIGIVLSGAVQILRMDYFGNRSILSELGPAEMFGESFACAGLKEIPVQAVANEQSELLFLDCDRIMHPCCSACGFHQQLIYNLIKDIATKNLQFHQKMEIISKRTTREKLMTYLLLQAKKAGSNLFTIPFDRQELADYLEVDRSGLSAEIGKLRREGFLESRKNQFKLL